MKKNDNIQKIIFTRYKTFIIKIFNFWSGTQLYKNILWYKCFWKFHFAVMANNMKNEKIYIDLLEYTMVTIKHRHWYTEHFRRLDFNKKWIREWNTRRKTFCFILWKISRKFTTVNFHIGSLYLLPLKMNTE